MARAHILSLLFLAGLAVAAAAAKGGKVKISMRVVDEEESRYLDSALAAGKMVPLLRPGAMDSFELRQVTEEEAQWLDRFTGPSRRKGSHGEGGGYHDVDVDDDLAGAMETLLARLRHLAKLADQEMSHVEDDHTPNNDNNK